MPGPPRFRQRPTDPEASSDPAETIRAAARPGVCIVAIRPTQRDSQRATVRVSDRSATASGKTPRGRVVVTLNLKHIAELDLQIGTAWTPALAEQVVVVAAYDRALRQAMDRLNRRRQSTRELDRKLQTLGHEPAVRERVLTRLTDLGLLDDAAYAQALLRELQRRPAGPRLLQQKLYEKGIPAAIADAALQQATGSSADQHADALALARKKLPGLQRVDALAKRRRLTGQLARRGFGAEVIRQVLADLAQELK